MQTAPNGQPIRVIQQVQQHPQQVYMISQQPAPYPLPQNVIIQGSVSGQSAVMQPAALPPGMRPHNYVAVAAPMINAQPYRPLP